MRYYIFLLFVLLRLPAAAHAYHASIMEVHYNVQKQQLEVALKVFTDDFERALSAGQPRSVSLLEDPKVQLNTLTAALLRHSLAFGTKPGEALPWKYVGMERENEAHWIYLAVPLAKAPPALYLRNHLLVDTYPDQMNIVNLDAGGKKQSALFHAGDDVQKMAL